MKEAYAIFIYVLLISITCDIYDMTKYIKHIDFEITKMVEGNK